MSEQPGGGRAKPGIKHATAPAEALNAHAPWLPYVPTPEDIGCIQALARGDALPHQQQNALKLVDRISYNGGAKFFPGEDGRRSTDYALGRAYVGEVLSTIVKMKPPTRGGSEHG